MLITNKEELSWWNLRTTFNIGQTKKGHSSSAVSHGTPGSCWSCRTVRVRATRASKHVISTISGIIKGSWQLGTPRTEVLVEAWCTIEHVPHVRDTRKVPVRNVGIEAWCTIEHGIHVCHRANFPVRNVRIEAWCTIEHVRHVCDRSNIPPWNVWIEAWFTEEHQRHVRDKLHTPGSNLSILSTSGTGCNCCTILNDVVVDSSL